MAKAPWVFGLGSRLAQLRQHRHLCVYPSFAEVFGRQTNAAWQWPRGDPLNMSCSAWRALREKNSDFDISAEKSTMTHRYSLSVYIFLNFDGYYEGTVYSQGAPLTDPPVNVLTHSSLLSGQFSSGASRRPHIDRRGQTIQNIFSVPLLWVRGIR